MVGVTPFGRVLWGLIACFRLPGNVPAGLIAIGLGNLLASVLAQSDVDALGIGFYPPIP
jgi:AGZA family xanthine/uracil permease-like MFS transporter